MKDQWKFAILLCALAAMSAASTPAPAQLTLTKVTVVNMTPNNQSGEKGHDSEPNLAVNPADVQKMAATAFTPDPDAGSNAPIYISTDGGQTWQLKRILPFNHPVTGTGDITLRFASSGVLYVAALLKPSDPALHRRFKILRTKDFTSPAVMDVLMDRESVDMPYVQAVTTVSGAGVSSDRVYVGYIDRHTGDDKHATVEVSLNAANTPVHPSSDFLQKRIDVRGSCDGEPKGPVSPALHSDGHIYAAFFRLTTCPAASATGSSALYKGDVVVVRDDNWGAAFDALKEPSPPPTTVDNKVGIRIAQGVPVPYGFFLGHQRLGGQISIAVDPSDKDRVFVAWADGAGGTDYAIRVRRSTDGGVTWSGDLWTVNPATNPSLAINDQGKVGLLYQKYVVDAATGGYWETWLDRSGDGFNTPPQRLRLHKGLDIDTGTGVPAGPIGDFLHLLAVKRDFYGVFSGHNAPDLDNFDYGVQYQRNHDFGTKTLFQNDNVTPVDSFSSDPFFFVVSEHVIPDPCVRRPLLCGSDVKMERGLIKLKCLARNCTVLDFLPKNCLLKFGCPGCTARGLCPPYYHLFLYGLKDEWRVSIHDSAGNPVAHRRLSTRTGSVLSFRPAKDKFVDGRIGSYLLAFEMGAKGKIGTDYQVKMRLARGDRHYESARDPVSGKLR